ncbi:hypothetical protein BGW39_008819 [Mortierella sp. 14UC]|nr:hypothetical protein BGW39_008819 [Mortierella sp. 14UC]
MGLAQPLKFEGGRSFKRRQKMMDAAAAVAAAKMYEQEANQAGGDKEEAGGGKAFANIRAKLFLSTHQNLEQEIQQRQKLALDQKLGRSIRQEKRRLAREERIEKRFQQRREAQKVCGAVLRDAVEVRRQVEEEDAAVALEAYDDGDLDAEEDREEDLRGKDYVGEMYRQLVAEFEVKKRMTPEEREPSSEEEAYQLLLQQLDEAYYGANNDDYDFNDGAEDQDFEMRGPPISVGSAEELERLLIQLQEECIHAEVVRGAVTETIEAIIVPTAAVAAADAVGSGQDIEDVTW